MWNVQRLSPLSPSYRLCAKPWNSSWNWGILRTHLPTTKSPSTASSSPGNRGSPSKLISKACIRSGSVPWERWKLLDRSVFSIHFLVIKKFSYSRNFIGVFFKGNIWGFIEEILVKRMKNCIKGNIIFNEEI